MAKCIVDGKITLETPTERYEFYASDTVISSTDHGRTHELHAQGLRNKAKTTLLTLKEAPVIPKDLKTEEPALTHEQKMGLESIIRQAETLELQRFMNARAIQAAVLDAQKRTEDAEHKFNMTVLEAVHTGLSPKVIGTALDKADFSDLVDKAEAVYTLDTELLYATKA